MNDNKKDMKLEYALHYFHILYYLKHISEKNDPPVIINARIKTHLEQQLAKTCKTAQLSAYLNDMKKLKLIESRKATKDDDAKNKKSNKEIRTIKYEENLSSRKRDIWYIIEDGEKLLEFYKKVHPDEINIEK